MAKQTELRCPNLDAAGIDWKKLFTDLAAKIGPVIGTTLITILESLLAGVQTRRGVSATCPSGDCSALIDHLDMIIGHSCESICAATCAKALCDQPQA